MIGIYREFKKLAITHYMEVAFVQNIFKVVKIMHNRALLG
jgi:hypothetical protein